MRRLPVYFLLDVSESMVGEPIEQVEEGLATIIKELRSDPYALETVWLSIIAFAGKTKRITPLTDLISFYPPRLPIGGGTSLGKALDYLMADIDTNIVKSTAEVKGDWKPIIFLFTDGVPTDDAAGAIDRWNQKYKGKAFIVAIAFGEATDTTLLKKLTDTVLTFNNKEQQNYKQFFKWVTASIKTTSVSVSETAKEGPQLAHLEKDLMTKVEGNEVINKALIDTKFAIFIAKCQTTQKPYLIKYTREIAPSSIEGLGLQTMYYKLTGSYMVDNQYFDMCESAPVNQQISTSELAGFPHCPCCSNSYGFSACSCGGILCTGNEEVSKCPWCNQQIKFGFSEGHQNINRTRG